MAVFNLTDIMHKHARLELNKRELNLARSIQFNKHHVLNLICKSLQGYISRSDH